MKTISEEITSYCAILSIYLYLPNIRNATYVNSFYKLVSSLTILNRKPLNVAFHKGLHCFLKQTSIVRESDYSPAAGLFMQ